MRDDSAAITLERDCEAILIPSGTPLLLPRGGVVFIVQSLGGSYTVEINGSLARIAGRDADALGLAPPAAAATAEAAGEVDEALVWEQLKTCYDPEIPINIVDLGLIYHCRLNPVEDGRGRRVDVLMTLTAPGCGMGPFLVEDVRSKVAALPGVAEVNVELTFDPPWDQSRMSEAARLEAGLL